MERPFSPSNWQKASSFQSRLPTKLGFFRSSISSYCPHPPANCFLPISVRRQKRHSAECVCRARSTRPNFRHVIHSVSFRLGRFRPSFSQTSSTSSAATRNISSPSPFYKLSIQRDLHGIPGAHFDCHLHIRFGSIFYPHLQPSPLAHNHEQANCFKHFSYTYSNMLNRLRYALLPAIALHATISSAIDLDLTSQGQFQ